MQAAALNGSFGVGGTAEFHQDFDLSSTGSARPGEEEKTPGNFYVVLAPSANGLVGNAIPSLLSPTGESSRLLAGLDYRVGFTTEGADPKSFGISGTFAFSKVSGSRGLFALTYSTSR